MAFSRPSLSDLITRVEADFSSRLSASGALLRRAMATVFARVVAGAAHMLHGHLQYLGDQLFPDRSEASYLIRQAGAFGLTQTPPGFARASVTLTGSGTVPAGRVLQRSDGVEYLVDADTAVPGTATVTAVLAGAAETLTPGVALSFQSPVSGVDSVAYVAASIVDGADQETPEELRVRFLERLANPAHGGSVADYVAWAKTVAGVTRVWPVPLGLGPGTVLVRFVRDNDASPIPDSGEVAAVQAAIDALKPAHCTVTVAAPAAHAVAFSLAVTPNTSAVREAVTAELADVLLAAGSPGAKLLLSALRTAVGQAEGLADYMMASPSADVTMAANEIPTLGTVTFS